MKDINNFTDEAAKGIDGAFNACMYRGECRSNKAELTRLQSELAEARRKYEWAFNGWENLKGHCDFLNDELAALRAENERLKGQHEPVGWIRYKENGDLYIEWRTSIIAQEGDAIYTDQTNLAAKVADLEEKLRVVTGTKACADNSAGAELFAANIRISELTEQLNAAKSLILGATKSNPHRKQKSEGNWTTLNVRTVVLNDTIARLGVGA